MKWNRHEGGGGKRVAIDETVTETVRTKRKKKGYRENKRVEGIVVS